MWVALVAGERERASEPVRASEPRGRDASRRPDRTSERGGARAAGRRRRPRPVRTRRVQGRLDARRMQRRRVQARQNRSGSRGSVIDARPRNHKQVWRTSPRRPARRLAVAAASARPRGTTGSLPANRSAAQPSVCPRRCVAHRVRITPNHPLPRPSRRVNPGHPLPQPWRHAARILSTRVLLRAPALQNEPSWLALRCKWAQARARGCTRRTGTPTRTWRRCMPPSRCARKILLLASSLSS
jgi:hypothetical protein